MAGEPKDKKNYSDSEGYLTRDGKVRVYGFREPPPAGLAKPISAGGGSVRVQLEPGKYSWCACGHSSKQPFCDHAHRDAPTNRKSFKFEVIEPLGAYICLCKQTEDPPFCDGTCEPPE